MLFAVNVTAALPATPSNLGVFQATCVAVLSAGYGVGSADALGYGIILQAVEIATAVIMGAPALVNEGLSFRDVRPESYDGLILSGGRAPEYLRNNLELIRIVRHFMEQGKPVAALCHGSLILAAAQALDGKKIATYEALAPDMKAAGAEFQDREVAVDGNLVSSRTWMDLPFFMREFLKVLRSFQSKPAAARA